MIKSCFGKSHVDFVQNYKCTVVHRRNACWLMIRTFNIAASKYMKDSIWMCMPIVGLLSSILRSIISHMHKHECAHTHTHTETIWTVPWGWGREEGNLQSGLIRMLCVWWEERSSSFPNADPTSHAGSTGRQGPRPPDPPFLLGDSPGLLSVRVSSTPHPRGPHAVGTRCFRPRRSVRGRERFLLNPLLISSFDR